MYTKSATEKSSFIASRYINWWLRWCLRMTSRSSQAMRSKQAGPSTRCCVATCPPKKTQNKRRAIDLQRKYPLKLEKIQGNSTNFLNISWNKFGHKPAPQWLRTKCEQRHLPRWPHLIRQICVIKQCKHKYPHGFKSMSKFTVYTTMFPERRCKRVVLNSGHPGCHLLSAVELIYIKPRETIPLKAPRHLHSPLYGCCHPVVIENASHCLHKNQMAQSTDDSKKMKETLRSRISSNLQMSLWMALAMVPSS